MKNIAIGTSIGFRNSWCIKCLQQVDTCTLLDKNASYVCPQIQGDGQLIVEI